MKIVRILKYGLILLILLCTILIHCGQGYLLEQNIEYTDTMMWIKIILTWGVCPLSLIFGYNSLMAEKLEEAKAISAVNVCNGILIILVVILWIFRMLFFCIWQDREEAYLGNGLIMIENRYIYYEPINAFLYKRIDNIQEYPDVTVERDNEGVDEPGIIMSQGSVPDTKEDSINLQVFEQAEIKVIPEVTEYNFADACEIGTVQEIKGLLPGTGEGTWYTVLIEGIEYYYGQYDHEDKEPLLYGYSIIEDTYTLANGIAVGLTKEEILEKYPNMASMDFEGNYLDGIRTPKLAWNGSAYPRSYIGMDSDFDYYGEDYRWENQFDYVIIADINLGTYETLPICIGLLMKDDIVSAITFYYPTAN